MVLGTRRAAAVKGLRSYDEIPVFVAYTVADLGRWLEADLELQRRETDAGGPGGMPWSWRQRAEVLDAAIVGLGMERGGGGGAGGSKAGSVVGHLGDYWGVRAVQARHAMYLVRMERTSPPDIAARAAAALQLVEEGLIQPQSVYRKLRTGDPMQIGGPAPQAGLSARQQEKVLRVTADALAGITYGLKQLGDIDPAISAETRAALAGPFSEARAVITRLTRQLAATDKGDEQE